MRTSEPGVHEGYPRLLAACTSLLMAYVVLHTPYNVIYPRFPRIQHRGKTVKNGER